MAATVAVLPPSASTSDLPTWHNAMLGASASKYSLPSSAFAGSWAARSASASPDPYSSLNPHTSPKKAAIQVSNSGAVAAARAASLHGKLRKRTNSASSSSTARPAFGFARTTTHPVTFEEPSEQTGPSSPSRTIPKDKIKPYLRKISQKEQKEDKEYNQDALDLSRSAAENESLLGLAPYADTWSTTDLPYHPSQPFRSHARSISFQSQTSSGSFRPTAPFTVPIAPSPQPHPSSTFRSYNNSVIGSDCSGEAYMQAALLEEEDRSNRLNQFNQLSTSNLQQRDNLSPLRINTSGSFRRYATGSQSNLSTTPISTRARGFTNRSYETASPASQTSFDRAFPFIRNKEEPMDPVTRQASIQAARQAFAEREEAKNRRYERQEQKAADRRTREVKRSRSLVPMFHDQERRGPRGKMTGFKAGREYANLPPERTSSLPILISTPLPARTLRDKSELSRKKETMNKYQLAKAWLKTRTLDIGKKPKKRL